MRKSTIIKETVISIIIESTIHGLPNIFRAKEVFIEIIWLLFTIVSFLACTFYSYQSIKEYFNYEVQFFIDWRSRLFADNVLIIFIIS